MHIAGDLEAHLKKISTALAVLSHRMTIENAAGMTSLNSLAEDIVLPLLRILFQAPDLVNVNSVSANTEHVDLVGSVSRLGFQITTEKSTSKITDTLSSFPNGCWHGCIDRLVFVLLTPAKTKFQKSTKTRWSNIAPAEINFSVSDDIVNGIQSFLGLIRGLDGPSIIQISQHLDQSIYGSGYFDLKAALVKQVGSRLDYERRTLKYIPELFSETKNIKQISRIFAHPTLFYGQVCDELERLLLRSYGDTVTAAGLPPLSIPDACNYRSDGTWSDTISKATGLKAAIEILKSEIDGFEALPYSDVPENILKEFHHIYLANIYTIKYGGMKWRLDDLLERISCVVSNVLIITSPAGQGKTMFICNFVDTTLRKQGIPHCFLTGSYLSQFESRSPAEILAKEIFGSDSLSTFDMMNKLAAYSSQSSKPFVVVIDALNENRNTQLLAEAIYRLVSESLTHLFIRFIFTCRTEFFDRRFAALREHPIGALTHRADRLHDAMQDRPRALMVEKHFSFFGIDSQRVSPDVMDTLSQDRILLRIFSVAYGHHEGEKQPEYIASIYRVRIFEKYFERILTVAESHRSAVSGQLLTNPKKRIKSVITAILDYMLSNLDFTEAPLESVPESERSILDYLLDEEIILRRDLGVPKSLLHDSEEVINFTFDEFRDFLLTEHLVGKYLPEDPESIATFLGNSVNASSPVAEGTRRFLFHIARQPGREALLDLLEKDDLFDPIFFDEIFNVESDTLAINDKVKLVAHLQQGGWQAKNAARLLVRRWNTAVHPALNLLLLIDVVLSVEDSGSTNLIESCFERHGRDGFNLKSTCVTVVEIVEMLSKESGEEAKKSSHALLMLVAVVMPLDANASFDSPAYRTLQSLIGTKTEQIARVADHILRSKLSRVKPFAWRLAAKLILAGSDQSSLSTLAEAEIQANETSRSWGAISQAKYFLETLERQNRKLKVI